MPDPGLPRVPGPGVTEPAKRWIWVSLPYATFGIAVAEGVVVEAPPIAKWVLGRDEREVAGYFRRRGAKIRPLDAKV